MSAIKCQGQAPLRVLTVAELAPILAWSRRARAERP